MKFFQYLIVFIIIYGCVFALGADFGQFMSHNACKEKGYFQYHEFSYTCQKAKITTNTVIEEEK